MIIPWCFGFILSFWSMAVDIFDREWSSADWRWSSMQNMTPIPCVDQIPASTMLLANAYDVGFFSTCMALWPDGTPWSLSSSRVRDCIRNVMQIDRLQVKKYWMKTAWSKLRLARTKRWFLLISQLLSHHVLSWYHADNCQAVKSMVDAPHYVRTVKRAKLSRKFNAGC